MTDINDLIDTPSNEATPSIYRKDCMVSTPDIHQAIRIETTELEDKEKEKRNDGRGRSSSDSIQYSSSTSSSPKVSSVSDTSDNTGRDSNYLNISTLDTGYYAILGEPRVVPILEELGGKQASGCGRCNGGICASPATDESPIRYSLSYSSRTSVEVPIELSDCENLRGSDDTCQPNKEMESNT